MIVCIIFFFPFTEYVNITHLKFENTLDYYETTPSVEYGNYDELTQELNSTELSSGAEPDNNVYMAVLAQTILQ